MSCNGTTGQSEACHIIRTHVSVAAKEQVIIKAKNYSHSDSVVDPDREFFSLRRIRIRKNHTGFGINF
jgi:hypothetical protein